MTLDAVRMAFSKMGLMIDNLVKSLVKKLIAIIEQMETVLTALFNP